MVQHRTYSILNKKKRSSNDDDENFRLAAVQLGSAIFRTWTGPWVQVRTGFEPSKKKNYKKNIIKLKELGPKRCSYVVWACFVNTWKKNILVIKKNIPWAAKF